MAREHENQKSMAIVTDWQDRSSKKQARFNVVLVLALAIALVTTAVFFFWSKNKNHDLIVSNNMKYLQICGIQEADRVEDALAEGVMLITNIAGRYSTIDRVLPDTSVMDRLQLLVDTKLFDRIGHVSANGVDTTLEGVVEVLDRDYFIRGMRGESGYDFLKASRVTGRPCVVFYAPIYEEEEITGVMLGFYERERLNGLFSAEVLSYSPDAYLLLGDGSIVANSNHEAGKGNMLTSLEEQLVHEEGHYASIQRAIDDKARTSIMFEFVEKNGEPSVGVITQLQNCDWMILSILPGSVTLTMIENTTEIGRVMMFGISTVFVLLVIGMFAMITRQARSARLEMKDTHERLKRAVEQEKKLSFIADTLARSFSSVYLIYTRGADYERIEERQISSVEAIPTRGKWPDAVAIYVEKFVEEPYKETVRHFLDATLFEEHIGDKPSLSVEFMRADGGWRKMFLLPARRDGQGRLLSVLFAVQGIDDEKQKELTAQRALKEAFDAAQFANNAKTSFLSNMSHDIRTPMNAIIGMTMIASRNLDKRDKVADCLNKITSSCKHLLGLINEILDMSKIESGRVDLSEDEFSLTELVDDLVNMNQVLIKDKNHTLTVHTEGIVHAHVIGDKTRLQQVFTNLLTNAIKYTPAGGQLEITVSEDATGKTPVGKYLATFRDNGIGMSKDYMDKLFEPFTRARDNRLIGIQGTGLGMPIARNIIRMMNGDIEVESELNKGSCFKVSFMLKLQPDDAPSSSREADEEAQAMDADFSGTRVLLVEDNELNLEIAVEILSMLGLEIESAVNGQEAVDAFTASEPGHYDLIFMDVQMPVMDGYEATRAIRASAHADAQRIPIIAMTANAFSSDVRAALNAGMNAHVAKPIDIANVVNVLKKFLQP